MTNDLSRLKSQLLNTGLQVKDNPLFQVIDQLIRTLEGMNKQVNSVVIGGSSAVINNNGLGQGLTIPLFTGDGMNGIEYYGDSPYPALINGIPQNIVTNNNNVINQNVLMNEYFDKEYADDPYPSLGTSLPVPVAVAGNPTITDDTTTNADMNLVWVNGSSGSLPLFVSSLGIFYNPFFATLHTGSLVLTGSAIITNPSSIGTGLGAQAALDIKGISATQYALKVFSDNATNSFGLLVDAGIDSGDYSVRVRSRALTDYFVIRGDGLVGIGVTPSYRLHVVTSLANDQTIHGQNTAITGDNYGVVGIANGIGGTRNTGLYGFGSGAATNYNIYLDGSLPAGANNWSLYSNSLAQSYFAGNVGIGTTGPSYPLHVIGPANSYTIGLQNPAAAGTSYGMYISAGGNTSDYAVRVRGRADAGEYFAIRGDGNVGIGTTSPQNLFVVSNAGARGIELIPASGVIMGYNRSTVAYTALTLDGSDVSLSLSGTSKFSLVAAGNIGVTAGLKFNFDGTAATGDTYIYESAANVLDFFVGAAKAISLTATTAAFVGAISTPLGITSSGGGIGYTAGAGGSVTQITSRATTVILNELCGNIIMFAATQAAQNIVTFTLTNSFIEANDQVFVTYIGANATNRGMWNLCTVPAAGSCVITIRNVSTVTSASEATPLRFTIIKGAVT